MVCVAIRGLNFGVTLIGRVRSYSNFANPFIVSRFKKYFPIYCLLDYFGKMDFEVPIYIVILDPIGITADETAWRMNFELPVDVLNVEPIDVFSNNAGATQNPPRACIVPTSLSAEGITYEDSEEEENGSRPVDPMSPKSDYWSLA